MKVAVAQLQPGPNKAHNIDKSVQMIQEAAAKGVELIVLPELCTSPYQLGDANLNDWAEEIPSGTAVTTWLDLCRRLNVTVIAGVLEQENGHYYNTAVCLDPSGLRARYRKMHLFSWERQRLTAGDQLPQLIEVGGLKLGLLICYDLRFVEVVRLMALTGIQLLCMPKTWTDVGKPQPFDQFGLPAAAHLALGHAYANKIYLLCAGRVGTEGDVTYLGSSLIAAPNGHLITEPVNNSSEALLIADIDPKWADAKEIGNKNHVFNDRRGDLY